MADLYAQRLVAAKPYIQAAMVDVSLMSTPFLALLKQKKRYLPYEGTGIEVKVLYGKPEGVEYRDYDLLPTKPTNLLTKATFEASQQAVQIVMNGRELTENKGSTQEVNLWETAIDAAKASAREILYTGLFSDGTRSGGKGLIGLPAMLPDDPTVGIYGGINRATNPWWRPGRYDVSDGDIPGYATVNKDTVLPILRNVMAKHSAGAMSPNLLVVSPEWAAAVHDKLDSMQIVKTAGETASLGFNTIKINVGGKSLEMYEESGIGSAMPANTAYLLDINSFSIRYNKHRNFELDEARKPLNQDAMVQYIFWMGQFVMDNARHNAVITM